MRLIDADALSVAMYHEAFENDASYDEKNPMAKWDSGLWVRYKMFERCLESAPSIDAAQTVYGYDLSFLALIATVMLKENVTSEDALAIMKDTKRVAKMIYDEQAKSIRMAMEEYLKGLKS